ncbi:MAG: HEAT repeat domain-containing protein [Treponema sp.]|nr:HEAT repeat domain-containing protein [Treponema sp.]
MRNYILMYKIVDGIRTSSIGHLYKACRPVNKLRELFFKSFFIFIILLFIISPLFADETGDLSPDLINTVEAKDPSTAGRSTLEEQRLQTLRFGTETEIAKLIQDIKNENISYLDSDLIEIVQKTRNRNILTGVFSLFADMEKLGLEDRAIRAIHERDEESNDTVLAAVDYLGKIRSIEATDYIIELINSRENRFLNNSFRALGRIGNSQPKDSGDESINTDHRDKISLFLLDYYKNRNPSDDITREIIIAIGEAGSKEAVAFLSDMVKNTEERAVLRMAALEAISKIGDTEGLEAVIEAVASPDPNIRSTAIAALGPFSGEEAEKAILEGFRDSYYRSRIGAAQAAGNRKLESAVPFLKYRAENDDVPAVKDEAIKALGAINTSETNEILDCFFTERKNTDRVRIIAAEMLLKNNASVYGNRLEIEMEEAQSKRQTALYNGFVRILAAAKSPSLEDIARRFMAKSGVIEKSLALDLVLNNEYKSLADNVRALLDEKVHSATIARKARSTLDKLGLE